MWNGTHLAQDRVLLAAGELELAALRARSLASSSLTVRQVGSLAESMLALEGGLPDLLVLGSSLIGNACGQVTGQIREISRVPILLLCPETSGNHVASALSAGADDHVSSAVNGAEFEARVRALLRRNQLLGYTEADEVTAGQLRIDYRRAACAVNGAEVKLTRAQLRLLRALASRPGQIVTHSELITQVWGGPYHASDENLRKLVQRVRAALDEVADSRGLITSVARFGYRLETEANAAEQTSID